jgi:hypothetical protein
MSEPNAPVFTGTCLCGAIRYEARGMPIGVNHCHCVQCQRASGAALLTWATWPRARVRVLRGQVADFESSPGVMRSFCARCGSTLFWRRVAGERDHPEGGELDIAAGTLDQGDLLEPKDHIFVKSRRRWLPLCDGLPAYAEGRPRP